MTDAEYLHDLADRLFHIAPVHGVDQGDVDRVRDIATQFERMRYRHEVDEQDVDEADIGDVGVCEDSPQILAWMAANGFEFKSHSETDWPGIWHGGLCVWEGSPMPDERVINALARAINRPPLDVLDEIKAMPVDREAKP